MVLKIVDSFQMFRVIVISFVCVRQSLKIEKRKNWIKLKLRYFTGAHVIRKTDQGGASYSLGNRQLQTSIWVPDAKLNLSEDQHLKCCFFQVTRITNDEKQKKSFLYRQFPIIKEHAIIFNVILLLWTSDTAKCRRLTRKKGGRTTGRIADERTGRASCVGRITGRGRNDVLVITSTLA